MTLPTHHLNLLFTTALAVLAIATALPTETETTQTSIHSPKAANVIRAATIAF